MIKPLFLIIFSFTGLAAKAAVCCGGSVSTPGLISGDERAQLSISVQELNIGEDAQADGLWRKRSAPETVRSMRLEGAHIFRDRWQVGASLPLVERARAGRESSGLGDATLNLGYEYLPDWDYNPWRPKGVGFVQVITPTGRSIYESDDFYQLDSRGRGFWSAGVGTLLTKSWGHFDAWTTSEIHRSLPRGSIRPGSGLSLAGGGGWSWGAMRAGAGLSLAFEDGIDRTGEENTRGRSQRVVTALAVLTYAPEPWSASLSFSDQTLFGQPVNTTLSSGVQLQLQHRFDR